MYQTLYRKYRPTSFDETIGQDVIIKTIKNAIRNNKLVHAYLFTGPRGTGKTSVAKIIAKTINCNEITENTTPCNKCVNCTQINNHQSIDIIEIDAASNNGVDEIRELKNNVNLVPATGKYKIYIIDEVHMLTTGAFNALLKTLEEPPKHIIFILATTEPHKIPNTILSRCQRFDFKKISINKIVERINYIIEQENIKIEKEAIEEIARLSDGGMRDALSILDQVIAYSDDKITLDDVHEINGTLSQEQIQKFVLDIINKNEMEIFKTIDLYDNNGKNFVKLTEEIILFLRNVLLYKTAFEYLKQNNNNYQIYEEISKKLETNDLLNYIEKFNDSIYNMKKLNKTRILFEINIISLLEKSEENKKIVVKESLNKEENSKKENKIVKSEKYKLKENIDYDKLENLKKIRINNSLCKFNKKQLLEYKNKIEEFRIMLMNPDYSDYASLIFDGELKVYGDNYFMFVFDNDRTSKEFNEKIIKIDEMFKKVYLTDCKVISTNLEEWNVIKEEYNKKIKKYEFIEEPENLITEIIKSNETTNEIEKEFEELIQYN